MTRLADANTSQEIELSRYFRRRTDKRDLLVLVEGDDDIPFWKLLFQDVAERYARIDIQTLKLTDETTGAEKDQKGKAALMEIENLGPSKVVAVDMDYDNIVPNYHSYSSRIGTDKYVLHTTYYSIENHKLYPDIIGKYAEMTVKDTIGYNFEELLENFSKAISPVLLLLIAYEIKRAIPDSYEQTANEICISQVFQEIASLHFHQEEIKENNKEDINRWGASLLVKYQPLMQKYANEISALKQTLQAQGVKDTEYWKYLQGHSLANCLLRVLEIVIRKNMRDHEASIRSNIAITNKVTAINTYHQSLGFVAEILKDEINHHFIDEPLVSEKDGGVEEMRRQIEEIEFLFIH